jgi:hypothetical protein
MNFENIKKYLPLGAVGLPIVLALIVFIIGLCNSHAVSKAFLIISAILLLALAGVLFVLLFVLGEKKANYFLTDPYSRKRMPLERLTFKNVNDRMNAFIAERTDDENEIYSGQILLRRGIFGPRDIFRPLVVYKILFDMAELNSAEGWGRFFAMSEDVFSRLTSILNAVNDNNMARRLMQLRQMRDMDRLADFIAGNRRYIQGRMMLFIRSNIEIFDDIY